MKRADPERWGKLARLALALTARAFGEPCTLGDVRWVVQARFHLHRAPLETDPWLRECITRFLAVRPTLLADGPRLRNALTTVLDEESEFAWEEAPPKEGSLWNRRWLRLPGKPPEQRIEELLEELETSPASESGRQPIRAEGAVIHLKGRGGEGYTIPADRLPEPLRNTPAMPPRAAGEAVTVDPESLRSLADRIDAGLPGPPLYGPVACAGFLKGLKSEDHDHHPGTIPAGTSQLVAPTGSGKSVFMRLQALEAAGRGTPVALVVPDIATVWRETRRLEQAARAAGCDLRIAPLSGIHGFSRHLPARLADAGTGPEEAQELLSRFGHACLLQAYATGTRSTWGEEPCTQLRQIDPEGNPDHRARPVDCPFADQCDRYRPFRDALGADILVLNHHAFLFGRSHRPVVDHENIHRRPSLRELVLWQAGLVVIDEVDSLQASLGNGQTHHEPLSSRRGQVSDLMELAHRMEASRPDPAESPGQPRSLDALRTALSTITREAESLAEAVDNQALPWPARDGVSPRGMDARLARDLFGEGDEERLRLQDLFQARDPDSPLPAAFEPLRNRLHMLGRGAREGTDLAEEIAWIHQFLDENPPARSERSTARIAADLVRRAVLTLVDDAYHELTKALTDSTTAFLDAGGQALAERFRNRIPWSLSPSGPLGTYLRDYRMQQQPGIRAVLESRFLAGDPHGEIAELGGLVSETLTGVPRAVLGLSATGHFPGSPSADVLVPLWAYLPDDSRRVQIRAAPVDVRISGRPTEQRPKAVRDATRALWSRILERHLDELQRDPEEADRRRALVVTNSYNDMQQAAEELRHLVAGRASIHHVTRTGEEDGAFTTATVERFGTVSEPAILVAPFAVIARGLNITLPHAPERSAIGSIFLLTRPVQIFHEPARILRHLSYRARRDPVRGHATPNEAIEAESRRARANWSRIQEADPRFSRGPAELRLEMVCDTLAELIQLAGRARRGGTPARLYLVDEAFEGGGTAETSWQGLIGALLERWQQHHELHGMEQLHGAVVHALADYAGHPLDP